MLAGARTPIGVRELAALADTDAGHVSRLLGMLEREALVDRTQRGRVAHVDWPKLLVRWSDEAPIERRTVSSTWLAPRGLNTLLMGLRSAEIPYAVTGSVAGAAVARVAPTRLASVYMEDSIEAARLLELREAEIGANVVLLQPEDPSVFVHVDDRDGLACASLPLVAADLLSGPGRSPAEADALLDWMSDHEEVWRG